MKTPALIICSRVCARCKVSLVDSYIVVSSGGPPSPPILMFQDFLCSDV